MYFVRFYRNFCEIVQSVNICCLIVVFIVKIVKFMNIVIFVGFTHSRLTGYIKQISCHMLSSFYSVTSISENINSPKLWSIHVIHCATARVRRLSITYQKSNVVMSLLISHPSNFIAGIPYCLVSN